MNIKLAPIFTASTTAICLMLSPILANATTKTFAEIIYRGHPIGESNQAGYEEWIELYSYAGGITSTVDPVSSYSKPIPTVKDIELIKKFDSSSTTLRYLVSTARLIDEVNIEIANLDSGYGSVPLTRISLTGVAVNSVTMNVSSGEEEPKEVVRLKFSRICWSHFNEDEFGQAVVSDERCYDVRTRQSL